MKPKTHVRWAIKHRRSAACIDGACEALEGEPDGCGIVAFRTRAKATAYINDKHGYIRRRIDLQIAPHGWRVPVPARVEIRITELPKRRRK